MSIEFSLLGVQTSGIGLLGRWTCIMGYLDSVV